MSGHQWCQDVPRDEAVRAAEDAAAVPAIQHRDLPDQVALLWAAVTDILGRVVRLEAEMDGGQEATIGSGDVFDDVGCGSTAEEITRLTAERDEACAWLKRLLARVAELEAAPAAPPEPRGWLTAEERSLVESLRATFQQNADGLRSAGSVGHADNLDRGVRIFDTLLARSSPPRVKVPHLDDLEEAERQVWESACKAWIDAIRAAGGEVE